MPSHFYTLSLSLPSWFQLFEPLLDSKLLFDESACVHLKTFVAAKCSEGLHVKRLPDEALLFQIYPVFASATVWRTLAATVTHSGRGGVILTEHTQVIKDLFMVALTVSGVSPKGDAAQ